MSSDPVLSPNLSAFDSIREAEAIIFDCDGVLIDVAESYDVTITRTVTHTLAGLRIDNPPLIDRTIIDAFKSTGGFNDEVDLAYAAIICAIAADTTGADPREFIMRASASVDSTGIAAIERYVQEHADISQAMSQLDYPGKRNTSPIHDTFNQIFYGSKLYADIFGREPTLPGQGMIRHDRVLVSAPEIASLSIIFGKKPAIVTGRGRVSFEHSVRAPLRSEFDLNNSVFLEDEPRSMAKPNPASLVDSIRGLNSELTVYVGDSMEDLFMAQRASELGHKTIFCGIIGTARDPQAKETLLVDAGAHATVSTVSQLAKILNRIDGRTAHGRRRAAQG